MASGLAETAKLVSSLELKDNFTPTANRAIKKMGQMESTAFKVGQNIGKGIKNAATNIAKIGVAGGVALAGAVALGVKSLGDLQRSQAQTAAVIQSTGAKAGVTAQQVRDMAESLENVSTVDDKVIQDGENLLLTFTGIGKTVFPDATKAMLNLGVAMAGGNVEAVDLKASAIQLGKALNDPATGYTALKRAGVSFTETQIKQLKATNDLTKEEGKHYAALLKTDKGAAKRYRAGILQNNLVKSQKLILAELNKEFGKAGEAAGKGPEAVMRRLQDAGEGVSQILARGVLPVLERFGTFLTGKLNDKDFLKQVDDFGQRLGEAGGKLIDFLETVDFKAIGRTLGVAADAAGTLVGWFLKMPAWVQAAVIGGWGLNKLTGGALGDVVSTLASGLIKGVLGMNAGVVNLRAGTVVGGGGPVPGGGGKPGGGSSALGLISKVFLVGAAAGVLFELKQAIDEQGQKDRAQAAELDAKTGEYVKVAGIDDMKRSLEGIREYDQKLSTSGDLFNLEAVKFQLNINGVRDAVRHQEEVLAAAIGKAQEKQDSATTIAEAIKSAAFGTGRETSDRALDRPSTVGPAASKQLAAIDQVQTSVESMKGRIAQELEASSTDIAEATRAGASSVLGGTRATSSAVTTAGYGIQSAIRANRPIINVDVDVSATTVQKTVDVTTRYGSPGGDREFDYSHSKVRD